MDVTWFPMLFMSLFTIGAVPIAVVGFLIWRSRRRSHFLPAEVPKPVRTASRAEAIALAGISMSLLVMLAFYRVYDGVPYALGDNAPASARLWYWQILGIWALIVVVGLALAWFRQTVIAAVLLTTFFCGAGFAVNEGLVFSYKNVAEEIRDIKAPLTVTIKGDVIGADVWFNDEYIGKTPIEADLDEVLNSIPNWEQPPKEFHDHDKFLRSRHGFFRPLAWFHVNTAKRVGLNDQRNQSRAIYARVELNRERLYAHGSHTVVDGSRIFGRVQPCKVTMDVFLPKWLDDVDELLNRARLVDYQVHADWLQAAKSYGPSVWEQLRQKSVEEPQFNRILDLWASQQYKLNSVADSESAWKVFERIRSEADSNRSYKTSGPTGRAMDLLVPKLDVDQLLDLAEDRIRSLRSAPAFSLYHGFMVDRFHFGTFAQSWDGTGPLTAGDVALAHAVWRVEILLDEKYPHSDNGIEERIVPALIRLSSKNGMTFNIAGALGGSVYEKFVLRHNWRATVHETDYQDKINITPIEVNRWLHTAAWMRSEAGHQFRQKNSGLLLHLAKEIVREGHGFQHSWSSNDLDFLFLDAKTDPNNLAVQFWPTFHRFATPERHAWSEASGVRWKYLVRMQPHCTADQFITAYRPYCDERCNKDELRQLEPKLQFKVLSGLAQESKRLTDEAKSGTSSYQIRNANHQDFVNMMHQVPCEESAAALMAWMDGTKNGRSNGAPPFPDANRLPIQQLRAVVKSESAALRRLVLPAVERRPTPDRRALLQTLSNDSDASLRSDARQLLQRFKDMLAAKLPRRR